MLSLNRASENCVLVTELINYIVQQCLELMTVLLIKMIVGKIELEQRS